LGWSRADIRPDPSWMPVPAHLVDETVIQAAMQRERLGLAWPCGEEIARVWGVEAE